jgi:hypothetical protein
LDADRLIPLPVFDAVAHTATDFLLRGTNVAVIAPPGAGASSVGARVQENLSSGNVACAVFDCGGRDDVVPRLVEFAAPKREQGRQAVILVDHAAALAADHLREVAARLHAVARQHRTAMLWLGPLDTRSIKAATGIDLHTDIRAHLCLPELSRDDLLRLYRVIAERDERFWGQWGEAMLYFVFDWCGNDLTLVEELVEYFYGDWTQRIYDESVAECLGDWLAESPAVQAYRERFAALPEPCKAQLRILSGGGKLVLHRPEIHLETCEEIRRLFLSGFLSANLLPGYYQFRNLLARYIVEEQNGNAPSPVDLLRRSVNGRVNALLQDVEVALRAMLRNVFRQMPPAEVKALWESRKTEQKLYEPTLQRTLLDWAGGIPVVAPFDPKGELAKLLKEEREKFEATCNLWTKVCRVFRDSQGPVATMDEPNPEQVVGCLTFAELSDLLQTLGDSVFLEKPRSNRIIVPPRKRWPDYLTKVRRLRNEAAHLRNIGFQDIEDLLEILDAIRQDQLEFLIIR